MFWFKRKPAPEPVAPPPPKPDEMRIVKPMPIIRGKLLIQAAHSEEMQAKMPKGYKLVAFTAVMAVPSDDPLLANGKLHDVVGAISHEPGSFNMPFMQLYLVATEDVNDKVAKQELGQAFGLPIWKF